MLDADVSRNRHNLVAAVEWAFVLVMIFYPCRTCLDLEYFYAKDLHAIIGTQARQVLREIIMNHLTVQSVLDAKGSGEVITIPAAATLAEFVRQACDLNIGAILARDDDGNVAGILTERDILRQCCRKADFDKVTVDDVMTRKLITVAPSDDIHVAMDLMFQKKIRHLPVMAGQEFKGVITVRDLIHAMRKADQDEINSFVAYLQGSLNQAET